MLTLFERSHAGRGTQYLPPLDTPEYAPAESLRRKQELRLPEISENELARHYTTLSKGAFGVNSGFYPLGSCTMKYNPALNEEVAALPGFTGVHPLQDEESVRGSLEALKLAEKYLCEITGMDAMTFQPAAGAHGEFTGVMLIKAYHMDRGDTKRTKIIVPDSAHGTNPASAVMDGFTVVSVPSTPDGLVDLDALRKAVGDDTAGLMLTNPNTVGKFDHNISEITRIVHEAGGLCYYDGANLNAIMGIARPGDMGFDVVHLNLHKTFSTPHGGGGPGSGPVGCKRLLEAYLPNPRVSDELKFVYSDKSVGKVRSFYGNYLVVMRALAYIMSLGREGIPEAARGAVLNANYLLHKLLPEYTPAFAGICMHEFVLTLEELKKQTGVSAMDIAKGALDCHMHPPTMYFPLIVHEALMFEPTETETPETLDAAAQAYIELAHKARTAPEELHAAPVTAQVRRLDEVNAARNPVLRAQW